MSSTVKIWKGTSPTFYQFVLSVTQQQHLVYDKWVTIGKAVSIWRNLSDRKFQAKPSLSPPSVPTPTLFLPLYHSSSTPSYYRDLELRLWQTAEMTMFVLHLPLVFSFSVKLGSFTLAS